MQLNVLIAEDEKSVRQNISGFINDLGIQYRLLGSACDGSEAIDFFTKNPVHILLTDIRMPKVDGFELIHYVYEKWPDTQTIILSGYDDFSYARRAMQYGIREYLLKPVSMQELNAAIMKVTSSLLNSKDNLSFLINQDKWDMKLIRLETKLFDAIELGNIQAVKDTLEFLLDGFCKRVGNDNLRFISFITDTLASLRKRLSSIDNVHLFYDQELKSLLSGFHPHDSIQSVRSKIEHFIMFCTNTVMMCRKQPCPDILFHCKEILNEHYKQEITLVGLARMVGVTPSYLSRLFKKELEINFTDYLNQLRIEKAKVLLDIPHMKILEIASKVGFNNAEYFSKMFKKVTGMNPNNYRLQRVQKG